MNTEYLKEFIKLTENMSYSETAYSLYLSQSTLSRHIQNLEEDLGIALFNRTSRKVTLTKYGEQFLLYAKEILKIENNFNEELKQSLEEDGKTIKILSDYNMIYFMIGFRHKNPDFMVQLLEPPRNLLIDYLLDNTCELAFLKETEENNKKFNYINYTSDSLVAVLPCTHKYANLNEISLEKLSSENFLMLSKMSSEFITFEKLALNIGFSPKIIFNGLKGGEIIEMVKKGLGITVLMKKSISSMNYSDISILDLVPNVNININIYYKNINNLSPAAIKVIEYSKNK